MLEAVLRSGDGGEGRAGMAVSSMSRGRRDVTLPSAAEAAGESFVALVDPAAREHPCARGEGHAFGPLDHQQLGRPGGALANEDQGRGGNGVVAHRLSDLGARGAKKKAAARGATAFERCPGRLTCPGRRPRLRTGWSLNCRRLSSALAAAVFSASSCCCCCPAPRSPHWPLPQRDCSALRIPCSELRLVLRVRFVASAHAESASAAAQQARK